MVEITKAIKGAWLSNSTYGRKMCLDTLMNTRIDCFALAEIKKLREDVPNIGNTMKQTLSLGIHGEMLVQALTGFDVVKAVIGRVLDNIAVEKVDTIEES